MKKIFLWVILLCLISFVAFYFIWRPAIIKDVKQIVTTAGYTIETIESEHVTLKGITLKNITLDKEGFNSIDEIAVTLAWHRFYKNPIELVQINNFKYSSIYNSTLLSLAPNIAQKIKDRLLISSIPRLEINNYIWDISTSLGPIHLTGNFKSVRKNDQTTITTSINTAQHSLSFNTDIIGTLSLDHEKWAIEITEAKLNSPFLSITRADGWLVYDTLDDINKFSGQLDAGSASIFSAPMNNLQLIIAQENIQENVPVILRTRLNGVKNSSLISDIRVSPTINNQDFELKLNVFKNSDLIDYLKVHDFIAKNTDSKIFDNDSFNLEIKHLKERRFADGPYPFSFQTQVGENQSEGTFIFYPDDLAIRGSATGNQDLLRLLHDILFKDQPYKGQDTLRFEKNVLGTIN